MKKVLIIPFLFLMFSCCYLGEEEPVVSTYEVVELSREALVASIVMSDPREVVNSGKIYIKDDYIFINEENEGFHIYDNTNPAAPVKIKFLEVPGATDIAVRNNVFYINQATDLVTLTFNNTDYSVTETGREIKVFTPKTYDPDGIYVTASEDKIIVNFIKK